MDNHELIDRVEQLDKKLAQMEQERLTLPILSPFFALAKRHYSLRLITSLAILAITLSAIVYAATLTKPFDFSNGQPASATEVNANFDALFDHFHPGFPEGVIGNPVNILVYSGTPYTVSADTTLYLTSATNTDTDTTTDYISDGVDNYYTLAATNGNFEQGLPLVFPAGASVETAGGVGSYIHGIEVDNSNSNVNIVNLPLDDSGTSVTSGYTLYIMSMYHNGTDASTDLLIDSIPVASCPVANNACIMNMSLPIIAPSNANIRSSLAGNPINITGYEIPN